MRRRTGRLPSGDLRLRAGVVALAVGLVGSSPPPDWRAKVAPRVLEAAQAGPTEFFVVVAGRPDLSAAARRPTKAERGRFVVDTLRRHAARSQASVLSLLRARAAEHRAFWVANLIWVRGDLKLLRSLAARADVLRIEANPKVDSRLPEPDEAAATSRSTTAVEWNIAQVNADQVWQLGYTGTGAVIGGQDTGYQWDHPALRDSYRGWDGVAAVHDYNWHDAIHASDGVCGADSPEPCDDHNHGTHTMGTMVGDDGGVNRIGVAPDARWIGCRNMDHGNGTPLTYTECFQWFLAPTDANGGNPDPALAPDVINNSWGCPPTEGCSVNTLRTIVENTRAAGIVVVTSTGNSGSSCSSVDEPPQLYEAAFSVGATNSLDNIASFSSRGPVLVDGSGRLKPDLSAPGVGVRSSIRGDDYLSLSGTSMAAPHVAGLVALLLDARPDLRGRVDEIETLIELSAAARQSTQDCGGVSGLEIPNNTFGHGRIDALAMLQSDVDSDGADNLSDCLPVDPATWSYPSPARELRLAGGAATTLTWQPPAEAGSQADPRYDVLRSGVRDDFTAATCVATDGTVPAAEDPTLPGEIFYYVVRVRNDCGQTLGASSGGAERVAGSCP